MFANYVVKIVTKTIPSMHSTLWKSSLHFVYIIRMAWNFVAIIWGSDPNLCKNILYTFFDIFFILTFSNICAYSQHYYSLLDTTYKFIGTTWSWNLHLQYSMMDEVGQWFSQLAHVTFFKNTL